MSQRKPLQMPCSQLCGHIQVEEWSKPSELGTEVKALQGSSNHPKVFALFATLRMQQALLTRSKLCSHAAVDSPLNPSKLTLLAAKLPRLTGVRVLRARRCPGRSAGGKATGKECRVTAPRVG